MSSALASEREPLRLSNGSLVLPSGVVLPSVAAQVAARDAAADAGVAAPVANGLASAVEVPLPNLASVPLRRVGDLPDTPRVINAMNVVIGYTLFGLTDIDICIATGLKQDGLDKLRANPVFGQMRDTIIRGVLSAEADGVRELFQQSSRAATMTVVQSLSQGSPALRLAAARDILDRAGHRPVDVVEHRHRVEGGLVIEIVRKDERDNIPTIEMEIM